MFLRTERQVSAWWFIFSFFAVFNLAEVTGAQPDENTDAGLEDMSLQQLMDLDIQQVTGASRYSQDVTEAPSSISIIEADEISKFGYRTVTEALNSVKSIYFSNDRTYDYLGMRGFSRPGDYNTRILMLVDGIPVNENIYSSSGYWTDASLDMDMIKRIEVIRGPGSSLYGTNAVLGVINIITKSGEDLQGPEIASAAGSFETWQTRGAAGYRLGSGAQLIASASWLDSRGDDLYFPEFNDSLNNNGIAEGGDYTRGMRTFAKASFMGFTLGAATVYRRKGLPNAPWGILFNDPTNRYMDFTASTYLKYQHEFGGGFDLQGDISYIQYDFDGEYVYDWSDEGDRSYLVSNLDEVHGKHMRSEVQIRKDISGFLTLIGGGEYKNNFQQDQKNYDRDGSDIYPYFDVKNTSWYGAGFAQAELRHKSGIGSFILNGGLRYDYYSTFGSTVNPRAALIYGPVEKSALKILYGTAFRAPNDYELHYTDQGSGAFVNPDATAKSNPGLNPENIRTLETVYEQYLFKNHRASVSGFVYSMDNLINYVNDPNDGLLQFTNSGRAQAMGVEAEYEMKTEEGLSCLLSHSFQSVEDEASGKRISNSPYHISKARLSLPLLREKIFLSPDFFFNSNRQQVKNLNYESKPFFIFNTTLLAEHLSEARFLEKLKLTAGIYNILDKKYYHPASEEYIQNQLQQDGRTYRIKIICGF